AADRKTRPGQKLSRIAPDHFHSLPRHGQNVCGDSRQVHHRVGSEIADSGLHIELPVGPDRHDSVVADGARPVRSHSDSDTPDFRTATLTRLRLALSPLESLGATVERL